MENIYPVYTTVEKEPRTICQKLDDLVFDYPFFNEGILSTNIDPGKDYQLYSVKTPEDQESLTLTGLIFNASHCGSTLLCRMLNHLQSVRIVSETEAINGLLLSKALFDISDDDIKNQLRKIIHLYLQKNDSQRHLIIKLTSWNVYFIKLFQQTFPTIKWTYLDRETEALSASLMQSDGGFIDWWNHPVDEVRKHFLEPGKEIRNKAEYISEMIRGHRLHVHRNKNSNGLFTEYPTFLDRFEEILHHFNIEATATEMKDAMKMKAYDSKRMDKQLWNK